MNSKGIVVNLLPGHPDFFRIFILLLLCMDLVYAQKPAVHSERLEQFTRDPMEYYRADFGKLDRSTGVIRYLYQEDYPVTGATVQAGILDYIQSRARQFGITSAETDLHFLQEVTSPGGRHFAFIQKFRNIPVYQAGITVTVNHSGILSFVSSTCQPQVSIDPDAYKISSAAATGYALNYLQSPSNMIKYSNSDLMIWKQPGEDARLVYRVQVLVTDPRADWEVLVDAGSGAIRQAHDLLRYQTQADGRGMIWDPDPVRTAGVYYGGSFIDNNDSDSEVLNDLRYSVTLNDLKYLNGKYYLEGPYVRLVDVDTFPADYFPALSAADDFNFTRQQQEFEDVMVYYHIDQAGRYLSYLGFNIPGLLAFRADPHGLNGADNSYYSPYANNCVFGEGGVDDAEDADVIWHEYNHAIMQNIQPWMDYDGETAALEEGSSDYWAASHSHLRTGFARGQLFIWDAGIRSAEDKSGTFWSGRRCDLNWRYPEDYDFTATKGHTNGQIWSSALMHIRSDLDREITDRLFIQTIYLWGQRPDFEDAAHAFIQADQLLYNGTHLSDIVYWFDYHGLIEADQAFPKIIHSPLPDTEDPIGPFTVRAEIIPAEAPLDSENLRVVWGYNGLLTDSIYLQPDVPPHTYYANIPGHEQADSIRYYITVVDTEGLYTASPGRAPFDSYTFRIGPDTIAPALTHLNIKDQSIRNWPARIDVFATDNMGIERVSLYYRLDQSEIPDSVQLTPAMAPDWFSGYFYLDSSQVEIGDTVYYRIQAQDRSIAGNISTLPETGFYSFAIVSGRGEIVFDFEADNGGCTGLGEWEWGIPVSGPRAALSGIQVWATDLDGPYSNGPLLSSLSLPEIDLQEFPVAALQFWHWYDMGSPGDGGNVKISSDGGLNWQVLNPLFGYDGRIDSLSSNVVRGEEVFTGTSGGWKKVYFNLDDFLNTTVQIRFDFGSDSTETGSGWYIDSVAVMEKSVKLQAPLNLSILDNRGSVILGWEYGLKLKEIIPATAGLLAEQPEFAFKIYRRENESGFSVIGSTLHNTFKDSTVYTGQTYEYYITTLAGKTESDPSDTVQTTVQVVIALEEQRPAPADYMLGQNYPNPFNPVTVISYSLPRISEVQLTVYDILGREMKVLVKARQPAGYYRIEFDAGKLATGIYWYRLEAGEYSQVRKMIVIR